MDAAVLEQILDETFDRAVVHHGLGGGPLVAVRTALSAVILIVALHGG
ncbi:hypothetical protein [Streptomyces mirabilis]